MIIIIILYLSTELVATFIDGFQIFVAKTYSTFENLRVLLFSDAISLSSLFNKFSFFLYVIFGLNSPTGLNFLFFLLQFIKSLINIFNISGFYFSNLLLFVVFIFIFQFLFFYFLLDVLSSLLRCYNRYPSIIIISIFFLCLSFFLRFFSFGSGSTYRDPFITLFTSIVFSFIGIRGRFFIIIHRFNRIKFNLSRLLNFILLHYLCFFSLFLFLFLFFYLFLGR